MKVPERLTLLRQKMQEQKIDAFVVYTADPHMNEYLPEQWKERAWLSGFTGSYGYMAVTQKAAGLWTDGRYFVQAARQLAGSGIHMYKEGFAKSYIDWLISHTKEGNKVAVNALATSHTHWIELEEKLKRHRRKLLDFPLLENVWINRPGKKQHPVFVHPLERAGELAVDKMKRIRKEMARRGATVHVLSSLDDVAWTLNLRGSDIAYNPVFIGYVIMERERTTLFIAPDQLTQEVRKALQDAAVQVRDYTNFYKSLRELKGESVWVSSQANQALVKTIAANNRLILRPPPGHLMKAIKNKVELKGFDTVMERDGVVMVHFLHWLLHRVGKEEMTEFSIGRKLLEFRRRAKNFRGESFPAIVGYRGNDALPHYRADRQSSNKVLPLGSILIDSGGQYLEGTTDLTRTVPLGEISDAFKEDYTLVMKAYLTLQEAKFPEGTTGSQIDALARLPLWKEGKDFNHGTGHGVGSFLNVHEGPQAIRKGKNATALQPGMVLSNEPGYYLENQYGIRHENLMKIILYKKTKWNAFYGFEPLTLCPFFKAPLLEELLTLDEKRPLIHIIIT